LSGSQPKAPGFAGGYLLFIVVIDILTPFLAFKTHFDTRARNEVPGVAGPIIIFRIIESIR
jgi:hypothetical protein